MTKPRAELKKLVEAAGGKVVGSVSKNTYALVIADPNSNSYKAKKARTLEVPIWSEQELLEKTE